MADKSADRMADEAARRRGLLPETGLSATPNCYKDWM
jgi:hypothetical protein